MIFFLGVLNLHSRQTINFDFQYTNEFALIYGFQWRSIDRLGRSIREFPEISKFRGRVAHCGFY